ncbi:hypothetical protein [Moorena producens]|uniref:hypothetical protein n=1 Tax=Moorena producens TaxID=1155739 RepID=UPI0013148A4C|nr:hypothetical protein [Moorena producens]
MQSASGEGLHQYKDDSSFPYHKILSTTLASCLLPLASCLSLRDYVHNSTKNAIEPCYLMNLTILRLIKPAGL